MRILITILFLFISLIVVGQSSFPNNPTQGNAQTNNNFIGAITARKGIVTGVFVDTIQINLQTYISSTPFIIVGTYSDNKLWMRNSTATKWLEVITVGQRFGVYGEDNIATQFRQFDLNGNDLEIGGGNEISIYSVDGTVTMSASATGVLPKASIITVGGIGAAMSSDAFFGTESRIYVKPDTIILMPYKGNVVIDSLASSNNAADSMMVRNEVTGLIGKRLIPTGGTGTVTSFSATDGNGFDFTVTNPTTTPTLSLTTQLTTGSVPFIGSSGSLTQNNPKLFWDNSNERLGIGTTSPSDNLHIAGANNSGLLLAGTDPKITISGTGDNQLYFMNGGIQSTILQRSGVLKLTGYNAITNNLVGVSGTIEINNLGGPGFEIAMGIGTTPAYKMDISGTLRNTTSAYLATSSGNVGIGTILPDSQLTVQNGVNLKRGVRFSAMGAGALTTDANGVVSATSDIRLKNIQGNSSAGLKEVMSLRPILYKWKPQSGLDTINTYSGFYAQNVKENIPYSTGLTKDGYLTLQDRAIMAALTVAIQELKILNDKQQKEINNLKKQLKLKVR